jgi:hypothetical protein
MLQNSKHTVSLIQKTEAPFCRFINAMKQELCKHILLHLTTTFSNGFE